LPIRAGPGVLDNDPPKRLRGYVALRHFNIGNCRDMYRYSGGRTASGEKMNPSAMTAAHRSKPFGSQVTVTSQKSGRSVTVRINDRGPFVKGRCLDLSTGAATALGMGGIERVSLN
jgi:peptidoglycan lytic transglycosylase